jgi:hypothetical protein
VGTSRKERMNNLRLIDDKEEPRKKDERIALVHVFNIYYEKNCEKKNPVPYSVCMRSMLFFKYEDHETGEIITSYPEMDSWKEQLEGFFKDDFARNNRGYHFTYFLKQYGSFVKEFKKRESIIPKKPMMIVCDNPECGKLRQPFGICEHCKQ